MKSANRFFLPFIAWLIISTILLTLPGKAFPQEDWFNLIYFDKWVHTGMFAIMAFLLCWGYYKKTNSTGRLKKYFILFGILCIAYGIGMEFIQRDFIPNRSFDGGDIVADAGGTMLGVAYSWWRYIKK